MCHLQCCALKLPACYSVENVIGDSIQVLQGIDDLPVGLLFPEVWQNHWDVVSVASHCMLQYSTLYLHRKDVFDRLDMWLPPTRYAPLSLTTPLQYRWQPDFFLFQPIHVGTPAPPLFHAPYQKPRGMMSSVMFATCIISHLQKM